VVGIAKPLAALPAALPSVLDASEPALIECARSQRTIARVQDASVHVQDYHKGEERNEQPGEAGAPYDNRDPKTDEEERQTGRRQLSVPTLESISLGTARGQPRFVGRGYGRTFPSAFHK
jgi:hypothetical protein